MDRIDSFERRLQESGHLEDEPAADEPRLPAIPQLHYVDWSEFKERSKTMLLKSWLEERSTITSDLKKKGKISRG